MLLYKSLKRQENIYKEDIDMSKELFKEYLAEAKKEKNAELKSQKVECLNVANDFCYPQSVFNDIIEATSVNRLNGIMHTATQYIWCRRGLEIALF